MKKESMAGIVIVLIFLGVMVYFFTATETTKSEIPLFVSGETRTIYEWAKTPDGATLLEQIPCYCGCKYEGHKNAYNCFWTDEGKFDKHSATCSVCLDIALKTKKMYDEGKDVCTIRKEIDKFYETNKNLETDTPLPAGCVE